MFIEFFFNTILHNNGFINDDYDIVILINFNYFLDYWNLQENANQFIIIKTLLKQFIKTITPIKEKFNIYVISQGREQNIKIIQFTFIKFFFLKVNLMLIIQKRIKFMNLNIVNHCYIKIY